MQTEPIAPERSWRDDAIDESLRGFNNSENLDALIHAIRRSQPQLSTISSWPNRRSVLRFLQTQCAEYERMVTTTHDFQQNKGTSTYLDWLRVKWKDTVFEVCFSAGTAGEATVCLGSDAEALKTFSQALNDFAERPIKRALRYSAGWEHARDIDRELGKITWDDITLAPEMMAQLRDAVEGFFAQRENLKAFGFAWKRGILLVGPPGTGKTMVSKAAAAALPALPFLYVRDLRERNEKDSIEAIFKRARKLAPCILVFEDLDGFINENNRAVFLNEMDGFTSNEGLLIIASSNHPGKIDEALLKRPSRFDRVFHLGVPAKAERQTFCEQILSRSSLAQRLAPGFDIAALAVQVAEKTDGFTPAYLKEAFVGAALQRAHAGALQLDEAFAEAVLHQVGELKAHLKRVKDPEALAEMRSTGDSIGFRR